ncbi:Repetin [Streptomyces niveus]|uniref:Repetin n=1 Tax=Streptomyces TaxID=1883 RepID=UPI001071699E|nr:Repetin [Streptomyces sp. 4R-3d]TFI22658.1 Repetin [Streptomyces sp. 4R-3d]
MSLAAPPRTRRRTRRTRALAVGAALLIAGAVASTGGSAVASPGAGASAGAGERSTAREAAALTGTAKLYRSLGDDITFTFDAHLAAEDTDDPSKATGTFRFSHHLNGEGATAEVAVDCLVTGGKVAVVSGVITESDLEGAKGERVGVTVHDLGRKDRLGYSWASTGSPADQGPLPKCVSSAPFESVKAGTGDFRVLPWEPKL